MLRGDVNRMNIAFSARAMWAAAMANVIFGFSFLFTKLALGHAGPYLMLAGRFFVAFLLFSMLLLFRKEKISLKGKPWGSLLIMGMLQPVLYFIGETYGVLYTSSTFSAIMIALIPIFSLWASSLFLKESPTAPQSIFCCLSVLGVIIITANTSGGQNQLFGVLFLLMAVVADVAFFLISRKISTQFTAFERTYAMMIIGFFTFFPMMLVETGGKLAPFLAAFQNPSYLFSVLYLGIASSVLAFLLINYASSHLPVTRTTVFINLTTLISLFAGVIFLRESFSLLSFAAAAMIMLGVWGVQKFSPKQKASSELLNHPSVLEDS